MASDPSFVQQINPIPLGKKEKNNTKIKPFETVTYNTKKIIQKKIIQK